MDPSGKPPRVRLRATLRKAWREQVRLLGTYHDLRRTDRCKPTRYSVSRSPPKASHVAAFGKPGRQAPKHAQSNAPLQKPLLCPAPRNFGQVVLGAAHVVTPWHLEPRAPSAAASRDRREALDESSLGRAASRTTSPRHLAGRVGQAVKAWRSVPHKAISVKL